MSSQFGQYHSGLTLPERTEEPMTLPDILSGTTFVSGNGRIYRLFGNEDDHSSLPEIPSLPPVLVATQKVVFSLETALQQIELFDTDSPTEPKENDTANEKIRTDDSPALQVFQALNEPVNESTAPKHFKTESQTPKKSISAKDILQEGFLRPTGTAPRQKAVTKKRERSLRILAESTDEPFIIPFVPPETPPEETKSETITLKIVKEPASPIISPKIVRKFRHHHDKTLYRKQFILPVKQESAAQETIPQAVQTLEVQSSVQTSFHWSVQLNQLMQTAENQIRMLADHLLVQLNQGIKTVCFNSVFSGDGCSTILLCTVRALLDRQYRILLIDAHHRHIDLSKQLNLSDNALQKMQSKESDVLKLSDFLAFWSWQESKTAEENRVYLANIIAAHREEYDFILLDNGSVTESPLVELIDFWNQIELEGLLLVSNTKRPLEVPVAHIAGRLRQHHLHVIGVAENYV